MIKKHVIMCSVMLMFCVLAKVFIYSTGTNYLQPFYATNNPKSTVDRKAVPYYNSLSFANKNLPQGDARVKWRMNKMLKAHNYKTLQTNLLHQKASKWFPIMEPILKYYGIPQDFKYVPLVESGLLSGTSSKGASGYWQFMPQTARDFGLRVNGNIDERQQVRKSTIAACKYIKSLYREFNNWTLVAAAYNIGEGSLKRQMQSQHQNDYFKMKLNRETASYVYKLISMKEIIENPRKYGYKSKTRKILADVPSKEGVKYPYFSQDLEAKSMMTSGILRN